MRLIAPSLLALMAALPAQAEDVFTNIPAKEVTLYSDAAMVTYAETLDLPAGAHRVIFPSLEYGYELPALFLDGADLTGMSVEYIAIKDPTIFDLPAQAEARAALEAAKDALEAEEDSQAGLRSQLAALQARLTYLGTLSGAGEGGVDAALALADFVQGDTAATSAAIDALRVEMREAEARIEDLEIAVDVAEATLSGMWPFDEQTKPGEQAELVVLDLMVTTPGAVTLGYNSLTLSAGWEAFYDIDLQRETGVVDVARHVAVAHGSDQPWIDVALTLSTGRPTESIVVSDVIPDQARIYEPLPVMRMAEDMVAAPMMEPEIIVEQAGFAARMFSAQYEIDGLEQRYRFPTPVTMLQEEMQVLDLTPLTLQAEQVIAANPVRDATAFLMAELTNDSGETIWPGKAKFSRDGQFLGERKVDLVPAGAEATLGFGPIDGIRLSRTILRNEEGDTGVFTKANTRNQKITFTVQNLTDEAQDIRALYPLPYSEQEDLRLKVTTLPMPDETDIDDKRGVSAWTLSLAPGEEAEVAIDVQLDWPEDQQLNWQP